MKSHRRLLSGLVALTLALGTFVAAAPAAAQLSETDRKAAARTAYQEGVTLQEHGNAREALAKFEAAQKLFDAPTHLLRIAQCQVALGKLVEAAETYETLSRKSLPDGSPDAFVQAKQQAQSELPKVRARIPTLRVTLKPDASTLRNVRVTMNGAQVPNEVLGLARPINPGTYRIEASASGWGTKAPAETTLAEKDQKNVDLELAQGVGAPISPLSAPPGQPTTQSPDALPPTSQGPGAIPPPPPYTPPPSGKPTSSPFGLLLGAHGALVVPAGGLENIASERASVPDYVGVGGGGGVDIYGRLVRMLLIGFTFEYASLRPNTDRIRGEGTAHTLYTGVSIGILPNVDKVSFIGDFGLGYRELGFKSEDGGASLSAKYSGLDFGLTAGISIPAGPIRIVPRLGLSFGNFSSRTAEAQSGGGLTQRDERSLSDNDEDVFHVIFTTGLALFYNLDLGKKPAAPK